MDKITKKSQSLAWLTDSGDSGGSDSLALPYLNAAAVLSSFDLDKIKPIYPIDESRWEEGLLELSDFSRQIGSGRIGRWQLGDGARRSALRRLGSREKMREAREINPDPARDVFQEGIDALIKSDTPPDLGERSLEQLLGLERATRWFDGILDGLPNLRELTALIEKERLIAPMRKLAGHNFINRKDELQNLADYVGVLPPETIWQTVKRGFKHVTYWFDERPPLLIHGPGGVGKSTLLAKFILMHADSKQPHPLPFIYLNFDRATLDPNKPDTLLSEAIRQIETEFPEYTAQMGNLYSESIEQSAHFDGLESAKSDYWLRGSLIYRFGNMLDEIAENNNQPVLLILDTLEEAEYHGISALKVIWSFLEDLIQRVDGLRIVVSGRSELPKYLAKEPIELESFDGETSIRFLLNSTKKAPGGPISETDAETIFSLVGGLPLSLNLAARVVLDEGIEALRSTVGRRRVFKRISSERQQGLLYSRILNHLHGRDKNLQKIACPGLIVRRITPEIITKVLAKPCGLVLEGTDHARKLFDMFASEAGLVDPYREDGALWHVTGVRRLMLPELRKDLGPSVQEIHKAAIAYYSRQSGLDAKTEELYHRLCMGEMGEKINRLWKPEMKRGLSSAFEELDTDGKIWLANKIGRELDPKLLAQTELADWELQTEKRVGRFLVNKMINEALDAFHERSERTASSPLYPLEVDVFQLLGDIKQAQLIAEKGIASAEQVGDRVAVLTLLRRLIVIHERVNNLETAMTYAIEARTIARSLENRLEELSAGVALHRLIRKATEEQPPNAENLKVEEYLGQYYPNLEFRPQELLKNKKLRKELHSRPALLKECAAEFGAEMPWLVVEAVELLGVSASDVLALVDYADKSNVKLRDREKDELIKLSEVKTARGIGKNVASIVPAFATFFANRFKQSVEDSLHQTIDSRLGVKPGSINKDIKLSSKQQSQLATLISDLFTKDQLALLLGDFFDLSLNNLLPIKGPFSILVDELLKYFRKQGRLGDLLSVIERSQWGNIKFTEFLDQFRRK